MTVFNFDGETRKEIDPVCISGPSPTIPRVVTQTKENVPGIEHKLDIQGFFQSITPPNKWNFFPT